MMFELWHATPPNFFGNKDRAKVHPVGYEHVATVQADDQSQVFALTNHIDHDWLTNREVIARVLIARSTSVGDVLVLPDGARVMYDWFGFCALPQEPA